MKSLKPQTHNIKGRTAAGATIMIASRLITRCIDFAALIVLARLLSPEDFGLVAIAMSVIMIVEAIMELPLRYAQSLLRSLCSSSLIFMPRFYRLSRFENGAISPDMLVGTHLDRP